MRETSSSVIPIPLRGSQAFLIQGDRPILVDTGNPGEAQKIFDALTAKGIEPSRIALIILTHCHVDHVGNVAALQEQTGAQVAIHRLEADALRQGINTDIRPANMLGYVLKSLFNLFGQTTFAAIEPDILLEEEFPLDEFGVRGKVVATPGHTPGSVSVLLESGEAIIGDLLMGFSGKRLNYPIYVYDRAQVERSVQCIMAQQPTHLYAAHGGVFDAEPVRQRLARSR